MILLFLMFTPVYLCSSEEGDVTHIYPESSISILLGSHSHVLPYLLGWIENVKYPKMRLHLDIYLTVEAKKNATREEIQLWKDSLTPSLFKSITINEIGELEGNWATNALNKARQHQSSFLLFWNGEDLPSNSRLLMKIFNTSRTAISSLLVSPSSHRGRWNIDLPTDQLNIQSNSVLREIDRVSFPFVFNLDKMESASHTFDGGNNRDYDGSESLFKLFEMSAKAMEIPLFVDRFHDMGWHFDQSFPLEERKMSVRKMSSYQNSKSSSIVLPQSRSVRATLIPKKKFGFVKISIINLLRRPERRNKLERICDVIGIDCEFVEATDGRSLPSSYSVAQLDSFLDPHGNRKMTNGEVGCFLSHYRIWESIVSSGLSRVLILEDDARFMDDAFQLM
ncbi:hypothetical protein PENTCL1PPCAC_29247, partial [Pristionchus entomophagus]